MVAILNVDTSELAHEKSMLDVNETEQSFQTFRDAKIKCVFSLFL